MTTQERIENNITARKAAKDLYQLILEVVGQQPLRFWEELAKLIAAKLPPVKVTDPEPAMTDAEAISFEAEHMPFGYYQNTEVGLVPRRYFLFLLEGEFAVKFRRYVKSERFQKREE